jgi:hypothetical protein
MIRTTTHNDNAGSFAGTNGSSCKKNPARQKKTDKQGKNALTALSEYSLSEFLENEPDLYSVSDLKVRYK